MGSEHPADAIRRAARSGRSLKQTLLLLVIVGSFFPVVWSDPIPQSLSYHDFSDVRTILSVPNFLNVSSNLAFLIVGALGLRVCLRSKWDEPSARTAWITSFIGIGLVSFGSALYHWNPENGTLVFDRIPMSVGFMGLFVALLGEYVSVRLVAALLPPALILGLGSVVYWQWTDDLRLYYWVQAVPLLAIPILLLLFRGPDANAWGLSSALGCYVLAKIVESNDVRIWEETGEMISGHTVKHLLAAAGCYFLVHMLRTRGKDQAIFTQSEPEPCDAIYGRSSNASTCFGRTMPK